MRVADAHLHLADDAFVEDYAAVLQRASAAGVSLLINVTTTQDELVRSFAYAKQAPAIQFCHVAGTPPQDAQQEIESHFAYFVACAQSGKLDAIGEVGLDYLCIRTTEEKARQHQVLKRYLALALECHLPVVVHCRGAFPDLFHILDAEYCYHPRALPGMLHCFTGSLAEAQELIARGWMLSISGIATFKNAENLRQIVAEIPLSQLLIETDAPFLAPTPFRGQRNEPAYILKTMDIVATIHGMNQAAFVEHMFINASRFIRRSVDE